MRRLYCPDEVDLREDVADANGYLPPERFLAALDFSAGKGRAAFAPTHRGRRGQNA